MDEAKPVPQDVATRLANGIKMVLDAGYTIRLSRSTPVANGMDARQPVYHGVLLEGAEWRTGASGRDFSETMLRLLHTHAPTYFAESQGEWQSDTLATPEHDTLDVYDKDAPPWTELGTGNFPAPPADDTQA